MGLRRREWWIVIAIAAAFTVLSVPRAPRLVEPPLPPLPATGGREAPVFELPLAAGGRAAYPERAGDVVLLHFWATWCPPCREELPALQALHAQLAPRGLRVLAVSVDGSAPETVARFAAERGLGFAVLHDPGEEVARRYGVAAYPTSVVIDRAGRVLLEAPGAFAWDSPASVAWFRSLLEASDQ
jgi:peroxiredoxin